MKQKLYLTIFFWVFLCVAKLSAQNEHSKKIDFYKSITFGDRIDFGNIDASTSWQIIKPNGAIEFSRGHELNNYVFSDPGIYIINHSLKKDHSGTCNHANVPENAKIFVSSVSMRYDLSKVKFSKQLSLGSCDGILVTVPVDVESFDKITEVVVPGNLQISGVGTDVQGVLDKQKSVMSDSGRQELTYILKGTLSQKGYVMLDFRDCNQNIQTYYLPEPIH